MRLLAVGSMFLILLFGAWPQGQVPIPTPNSTPTIISGPDIGFQVEATSGGVPSGRLVVKVNGKWVEPKYSTSLRLLKED